MANSDIIKIGFDYRASLAQFEKETNGVFDGISNKAGKQKIIIQLDAKDDKVIDKIKELQKLKLDKFTFEFGNSGLKEQLQTFDKLENKINEIIGLSKGIDLSFNTKNKTDAYNQLKKYADAFKDYYGNEEAMATNAGAKAGYAYYKAYEEALRKGVAQSKLEKVTIDFDVNDSFFSKERIVGNRIKEFENFQKYGNADESNLIAEITSLENRLLKFNSAYSQVKANLGDAPITPEITKNIEEYVRLLEVAESRAKDAELFGYSSEDINSDKDLANMYLDFAKEDATAKNKKYIESLKQEETQTIATAEAEQKLAVAQKETVSNTSNSNNSQIEELKSDIQEVKTELGDVKDRISSIESNGFENVRDDVEKTKESVKELNSEFAEMKSNLSSTSQESNISSGNTNPPSPPKKDRYAKRRKISEEDFLNYSPNRINEKLLDSGYTILGETVNTELVDGLVKVSAKIKDAEGAWKSFSAKVDADGNIFEQRFKTVTNGVDKLETALQNFGRETAPALTYQETLDKAQKIKNSLNLGDEYSIKVDSSEFVTITKKLTDVDNAGASVTQTFKSAQDAIDNFGKAASNSAEKTSVALKSVKSKDIKDAFPDKDVSTSVEAATNSIKEENNVLEQNTQKVKENTQAKEQNVNVNLNKYDKRLDSYNGKIDKYKTTIDRFNDGGWTSSTYLENVQAVKNAVKEYETLLNELKGKDASLVTSEDISKLDNYEKKIKDTIATVTNMSASEKGYNFVSGQKELDKIHKLLAENSNMSTEAKVKIKAYYAEIESGNPSMSLDKIHGEILKIYNAEVEAGRAGRTLWDTLKNSGFHQIAAQMAGMFGVYDVINVVRQGVNTVRELDEAMTEVRKVSNATETQYASFRDTISSTAKEIATTNKELLNSSADFLRLGYSLDQASDLAKNATLFVNVGDGVDITEATEDMITAMKAFDIQAEDSIKIVDDYNQIGNQFALSASDIGEAMKRSASALETGNNSFEQSIGLITAMNEIVQNSENTGNSLKVLSLRLRGAKAELEDMQEDTDGLCDSTSKLREQIMSLTGVDIMLDDNTFKSTTDIIKELGAVWDKLSDSSQAATLELIAGKSRANNVAALLKNYQRIDEVMESLGDAEGSAMRENEAIVDSIDGRIKKLSASMEDFWQKAINTDFVKNIVSSLDTILNLLTKIIDQFGLLPTIIGVGGAGTGIFKFIKNFDWVLKPYTKTLSNSF